MKKTKQFSQFSQVVSSRFSKVVSFLIIAFYAILFSKTSHAQCSPGAGCFIKGDYVEVGVSTTGAFGACTPPSGYHNNVVQFACSGTGTTLGFVSDPDKDGWLVSSPGRSPYMGDYFVPGGPYEGGTYNIMAGQLLDIVIMHHLVYVLDHRVQIYHMSQLHLNKQQLGRAQMDL